MVTAGRPEWVAGAFGSYLAGVERSGLAFGHTQAPWPIGGA